MVFADQGLVHDFIEFLGVDPGFAGHRVNLVVQGFLVELVHFGINHLQHSADGPGLGWSGRELIAHVVGWLEHVLDVARELAVGERSGTHARAATEWDARGDAVNDDLHAAWAVLPIAEVRQRLLTVPGELRGTLTVVPEARWLKDAKMHAFFVMDTLEHYEEHLPQLEAVLAGAAVA